MKIKVIDRRKRIPDDVYDLGAVPCVGDCLALGYGMNAYVVSEVVHMLNADPETQFIAVVVLF